MDYRYACDGRAGLGKRGIWENAEKAKWLFAHRVVNCSCYHPDHCSHRNSKSVAGANCRQRGVRCCLASDPEYRADILFLQLPDHRLCCGARIPRRNQLHAARKLRSLHYRHTTGVRQQERVFIRHIGHLGNPGLNLHIHRDAAVSEPDGYALLLLVCGCCGSLQQRNNLHLHNQRVAASIELASGIGRQKR